MSTTVTLRGSAVCLVVLLLVHGLCAPGGLADDVDIYLPSAAGSHGNSLVMLSLDLHPGLAQPRCIDSTSPDCPAILGNRIYEALDLLGVSAQGVIRPGADGQPDRLQFGVADERLAAWLDHAPVVTRLDEVRASLQVVLRQPVPGGGLRVAMMLSHDDSCTGAGPAMIPLPGSAGCSNGAYILSGFFRPLDDSGQATPQLQNLFERLAALPLPSPAGWQGHPYQLEERYLEYYRYITGGPLHNAQLGYTDYGSLNAMDNLGTASDDVDPLLAPDSGIYQPERSAYVSPVAAGEAIDCSRLSMINLIAGDPLRDPESDAAWLQAGVLGLPPSPERGELLTALAAADLLDETTGPTAAGQQPLISHFVFLDETVPTPTWASAGGGRVLWPASDGIDLAESLTQLLAVQPAGGGASLVPAAFAGGLQSPGRAEGGLYLSLFLPESRHRWSGNVKKYVVGNAVAVSSGAGAAAQAGVVDANGRPAFATGTGRIAAGALSFWTDVDGGDVSPAGCVDGRPPLAVDGICGADGFAVTRGGAGQQIPGFLVPHTGACASAGPGANNQQPCARRLFTENPSVPGTLMDFNHDTRTATLLREYLLPPASLVESAAIAEAMAIIGWARGLYDRGVSGRPLEGQRWLLGDVMHSRPLAINYGDHDGAGGYSSLNPDVRLFFGANDGWLRSLRDTTPGGEQSGREEWAFMPLEVMQAQQGLSLNSPAGRSGGHAYGVDGEPVALVVDVDLDGNVETDEGDQVILFFGLRRGGEAYYALDVSRPDSPPQLLWKITPQSAGFAQLALSFSTPSLLRVNFSGTPRQVLAFGGGYHGGWDARGEGRVGKDQSRSADSLGNAVYLVDPFSGELLWKAVGAAQTGAISVSQYSHADMRHSIASPVAALDTQGDGLHDRAYVGDTGGNIWRLDLAQWDGDGDSRERWQMTQFASLSSTEVEGDRRFFHRPDLVFARDTVNTALQGEPPVYQSRDYVGVVTASGDRAAPTGLEPRDYLYFLKDGLDAPGSASAASATPLQHPQVGAGSSGQVLLDISGCPRGDELGCQLHSREARVGSLVNGWALALGAPGEKGLSTPVTIDGTIYFSSYLPPQSSDRPDCQSAAVGGRLYAVGLADGRSAHRVTSTGSDAAVPPRYIDLGLSGIAGELPVILARRPAAAVPGGTTGAAGGEEAHLLLPDGSLFALEGRTRWKAYWREVGVDPD